MTQIITKNIVAVAFVVALFSMLLAMPQASEAKVSMSDMSMMKSKATASSTASSTKPVANLSCVQGAVEAREKAIIKSWTDHNTIVSAALVARKTALIEAWKITDAKDRAISLKELGKNWKDASKKAHEALKAGNKSAWAEFKVTMNTKCRVNTLPKEDAEPKDVSGGIAL